MSYLSEHARWALDHSRGVVVDAEQKYGMLTLADVARETGFGSDDVQALMFSGALLSVRRVDSIRFPGFQIRDGILAPTMRDMTMAARINNWSNADLFWWLVVPRQELDELPAADLVHDEPERVAALAIRSMSTDW